MAVIGEIRKHSGLLVGAIALSIVGFLVMDATNSQFSVLKGGRSNNVASVGGEAIAYQDYQKEVDANLQNLEERARGQQISEEMKNQVRQQTWDDMINGKVMEKTYNNVGVAVTDDEMVEIFTGKNPHPYVQQQFTNPQTGQFDAQYVKMYMQTLDKDEPGQEAGSKRRQWTNFEKEVKKSQLQQKYTNLVVKGMTTPSWMAEMAYVDANKTADVRYVLLPYTEVNDNDLKITDDELKKYLNEHAARFRQEDETRGIKYVSFDIAPSAKDSASALKSLTDKLEEFKAGKNKSEDSMFVKIYSETPMIDLYASAEQLGGSAVKDTLLSQPVGTVVGPYVEEGMFKFAKISARKMMSDSVRVREIVFSFNQVRDQAGQQQRIALIDSLYRAIDSFNADFGAIALAYSDDNNSKVNGGNIGWVNQKDPTKDEFYKSIVFHNGVVGKTYRHISQQENAVRLIQIVEEHPSKPGVKVAYFTKSIVPSPETERNIYATVSEFASSNATEEKFKAYAKAHPEMVKDAMMLRRQDFQVMGLGTARGLIKWAFEAKRGDISPIKTIDKKHVVAYLEVVRAKGTPDLDGVKEQVKMLCTRDKKFEVLSKKIKDAGAANVDALASKLGKEPMSAEHLIFSNPMLGSSAYEPSVVAAGVGLANGKMSNPIEGNQGVYVVQKISGIDPPKATDLTQYVMQLRQMAMGKAGRGSQEALKRMADVKDNRLDFESN
ncbi:MAG: SurA N-terminal domain-containing protein [Chitinophagales bacterium]